VAVGFGEVPPWGEKERGGGVLKKLGSENTTRGCRREQDKGEETD